MSLISKIPSYTALIDNVRAELDAIKSTPIGLDQDDFMAYLQLKTRVPRERRQDLRDAFLKFQDKGMMMRFRIDYL